MKYRDPRLGFLDRHSSGDRRGEHDYLDGRRGYRGDERPNLFGPHNSEEIWIIISQDEAAASIVPAFPTGSLGFNQKDIQPVVSLKVADTSR